MSTRNRSTVGHGDQVQVIAYRISDGPLDGWPAVIWLDADVLCTSLLCLHVQFLCGARAAVPLHGDNWRFAN